MKEEGIQNQVKCQSAAKWKSPELPMKPMVLLKILADAKTDELLGVHIVGVCAGELIAQAAQDHGFPCCCRTIWPLSVRHILLSVRQSRKRLLL